MVAYGLRIVPYFPQPILCKLLFFLHRILQERTGSQEVRGLNNFSSANEKIGKVLRRKPGNHFNDLANSCQYWGHSEDNFSVIFLWQPCANILLLKVLLENSMVGDTGIEPVTSCMSSKTSKNS